MNKKKRTLKKKKTSKKKRIYHKKKTPKKKRIFKKKRTLKKKRKQKLPRKRVVLKKYPYKRITKEGQKWINAAIKDMIKRTTIRHHHPIM